MELAYSPKEFREITNIGDTVLFEKNGEKFNGRVTMVNWRGIDVRTDKGTSFVKWVNVKRIEKKKVIII